VKENGVQQHRGGTAIIHLKSGLTYDLLSLARLSPFKAVVSASEELV